MDKAIVSLRIKLYHSRSRQLLIKVSPLSLQGTNLKINLI